MPFAPCGSALLGRKLWVWTVASIHRSEKARFYIHTNSVFLLAPCTIRTQITRKQSWSIMQISDPKPQKRVLHMLCAEDQSAYAALVVLRFEKAGHPIECVPTGQIAWEKFSSDPANFDLLVTDQQMSPLDGLSLARRLRQAGFPGRIIVHAGGLTAETKSLTDCFAEQARLRSERNCISLRRCREGPSLRCFDTVF